MYFDASPSVSPKSPAISIGSSSSMGSTRSTSTRRASTSSQGSACAYPSWPVANSLRSSGMCSASSYISDAELFGLDDLDDETASFPYLDCAPSPPRQYPMPAPMAAPMPLAPLYAPAKTEKKRRRSSRKQSPRAQPMTPITESPETPE